MSGGASQRMPRAWVVQLVKRRMYGFSGTPALVLATKVGLKRPHPRELDARTRNSYLSGEEGER